MKLAKGEQIITAFAQPASGPGWANSPVWVFIQTVDGSFRRECLQPNEQGNEIMALYRIAATVHDALLSAITRQYPARKR